MLPYDPTILSAIQSSPKSIPRVIQTLHAIDEICADEDGLKWFNWLYLQVTQAVEVRCAAGGFSDAAWLAELDVQFAVIYLSALKGSLSGESVSACWQVLFENRQRT